MEPVEAKAFGEDEVREVTARHPGLRQTAPCVVEGQIEIHHRHGEDIRRDAFSIRITANNGTSRVPALYEIGGRTEAVMLKHRFKDIRDLHKNPGDGTACVCVKQEEALRFPPGARLSTFVEELAVPYLYGLSYVDEFGKWPWGEYEHGALGLLEYYADNPMQGDKQEIETVLTALKADDVWFRYRKQLTKPSAKRACICGSGKPFGACHPQAWRGLKGFLSALARAGLNPNALPR